MPGGFEFKWFKDQEQGIQLISTLNARKANQVGLPNRDTERKVKRRAKWRALRYEIESDGWRAFLRARYSRKNTPNSSESDN